MQRLGRGKRQEQSHGLAGQGDQAVMPVKGSGCLILGIDPYLCFPNPSNLANLPNQISKFV